MRLNIPASPRVISAMSVSGGRDAKVFLRKSGAQRWDVLNSQEQHEINVHRHPRLAVNAGCNRAGDAPRQPARIKRPEKD
jgi:hypothetical protein